MARRVVHTPECGSLRSRRDVFLSGSLNCNLHLFIVGQRERAAEEFVSEPSASEIGYRKFLFF